MRSSMHRRDDTATPGSVRLEGAEGTEGGDDFLSEDPPARTEGGAPEVATTGDRRDDFLLPTPSADRRLGSRYTLDAVVGRGTTGEVWRAHDDEGNTVAVKLLRPELVDDPEVVARFLRERNVLRAVREEHVVSVRDLVVEGQDLGIVMDYLPRSDLRAHLEARGGVLAPSEATALVRQVLRGLAAIHATGAVHGDVKPEHVLIDEDRAGETIAKLSDFGVSRLLGDVALTRVTGVVGTARYTAPELGDGGDPSPASDLYAVGVLLYELVMGRPPFVAEHPIAVLRAHADQPVTRPDAVPDSLWHVLTTLLAKRPEERFADATTAGAALGALAPELAELAASPSPPATVDATPAPTPTQQPDAGATASPPAGRTTPAGAQVIAAITASVLTTAGILAFVTLHHAGGHADTVGWEDRYRGYVVKRYWWLTGAHGTVFHALEQVQPTEKLSANARYLLVVPKSIAARDGDVSFAGTRPRVEQADPVFALDIGAVGMASELDIQYTVAVSPRGRDKERLARWNRDLSAERRRLQHAVPDLKLETPRTTRVAAQPSVVLAKQAAAGFAVPGGVIRRISRRHPGAATTSRPETAPGAANGPPTLATLAVARRSVTLPRNGTASVLLTGRMSDGSAAPASVLGRTTCTVTVGPCRVTAGPDATSATAALAALAGGDARATLRNGSVATSFDVHVTTASPPPTQAPATLASLAFSVPSIALGPAGSAASTVTLTGLMSDGAPAPADVLAGSSIGSSDPGVVDASPTGPDPNATGVTVALTPRGPGNATITATSGAVHAELAVSVPKSPTTESAVALTGATLTPAASIDATADFGHAWASISGVCWELTFGPDLLDPPDDNVAIAGFGSVTATGAVSLSTGDVCIGAGADLTAFLGGTVGATLSMTPPASASTPSVDIASASVTVDGVPM